MVGGCPKLGNRWSGSRRLVLQSDGGAPQGEGEDDRCQERYGGEHEAQSAAARRRLGPTDEVGASEAAEIADRVDRGDAGRGLAALEKLGRQRRFHLSS